MTRQPIPYQINESSFSIRKIRANFDASSINEHPHRHEFIEFMYIKSGNGKHEIDGVEYDLKVNCIYIISKGQVHNFLYAKNIEGVLIRFHDSILPSVQSSSEGFYYNLIYSLQNKNQLMVASRDVDLIEIILDSMLKEYERQSSKILDLSLIQHLLYPLIILMNRYAATTIDAQDPQQDLYSQFINLLEQHYKQHHDLGFYGREMGVSARKLTQVCQLKTDKTAKKIINERLITEAKRLLKYTSLPLKEIVAHLGYKDIGYFCRYFKKATGKTPTGFKK